MREAGNELSCDRVRYKDKNNWDCVSRTLCRQSGWQRHCDNDVDLAPNQFNGIAIKAFILLIGEGVYQRDITAFNVTKSLQTLLNLCEVYCLFLNASCMPQDADCRDSACLLRISRERPSYRRAAQQRDELAPPHCLPKAQDRKFITHSGYRGPAGSVLVDVAMGHSRHDWLMATIGPRPLRPESDHSRHEPEMARWANNELMHCSNPVAKALVF